MNPDEIEEQRRVSMSSAGGNLPRSPAGSKMRDIDNLDDVAQPFELLAELLY